ncbi:MAG: dephospho-CoA kinase [Chloroflexi bacterium]|nr:dephospho-CoA kinase [Chloroflexota bacterium]
MKSYTFGTKPYLIGITGPIGSGKSLVRKMLEHLGALTIDADELAHQAYIAGSPGFDLVVKRFGSQVLDEQGQVDRRVLGQMAFKDHHVLNDLENIVHPLVVNAVENILDFSPLPIVAVEAIKLLESGLKNLCDAIWIVDAPRQILTRRLIQSRGMSKNEVASRLENQADFSTYQDDRTVIIINDKGRIGLWNKVTAHWENLAHTSSRFSKALDWTKETYQSFYMPLVQLSTQAAEDLNGHFPDNENLEETFDFLCRHFIWETIPLISGRNLVISTLKNRSMKVLSLPDQFDSQQLVMLFKMIEDFATLHLCTHITVPFYEEFKTLFREMGYYRYTNNLIVETVDDLPFKWDLRKNLLPEINYFKNGQKK